MHRAFAAWLIAKPWRALLFTAIFGLLSPQGLSPVSVVAGAIPVLVTLQRGTKLGFEAAVAGSVAIGAFLLAIGHSWVLVVTSVTLVMLAPWGLGVLLERTGSLRWCFQIAVLGAALLVIVIHLWLDDPVAVWQKLLQNSARQLKDAGIFADEQMVLASLAGTNWGTFATLTLVTVLCALFLGAWWHSVLQGRKTFGQEFQQLKLGKILGAVAVVMIVTAFLLRKLAINATLIDALMWPSIVALAFQGLAAVHRLKANGRLGLGWLTVTYVLLVAATPLMLMLLAGWGVADNWRRRA